MNDMRKKGLLSVEYRNVYAYRDEVVDDPGEFEFAHEGVRRVLTNLRAADFNLYNPDSLFRSSQRIIEFFTVKGTDVILNRCPACRSVYDTEYAHICTYDEELLDTDVRSE